MVNNIQLSLDSSHLQELFEFLSIKSISTDEKYKPEIKKAQEWLVKKLKSLGFSTKLLLPKNPSRKQDANAVVFAEYTVNPNYPTITIYGHYDVQPAGDTNLWNTPPFKPTLKDSKIYCRGANDNKGQLYANILAIEHYIKNVKNKKYNIKFFIEGEEEKSGITTSEVVKDKQFKELLKTDYLWIADGPWVAKDKPTIVYALRGIVYFDLVLQNAKKELHSGIYGNLVLNPGNLAGYIISKLKNIKTNEILVPGIYDKVRKPTNYELKLIELASPTKEQLKEETTAKVLTVYFKDNKKLSSSYLSGLLPSLDVHGIWGGYMQPSGAKTIIPDKISIKFSIRIVSNLTVKYVHNKLKEYLDKIIPSNIKWELNLIGSGEPYISDPESGDLKKLVDIMSKVFKKQAVILPEGGSIPLVTDFANQFNPIILMPNYGLPDDNLHAPNEKIDVKQIEGGATTLLTWLTIE